VSPENGLAVLGSQRKILRLPPARDIVVGEAMSKLNGGPIRPYWLAFLTVLAGLLVDTATAIAEARPLKTIVDNMVSNHHLPKWLIDSVGPLPGGTSKVCVAAFTALVLVAIAIASAVAHRGSATPSTVSVIGIKGSVAQPHETKASLAA
jgi:hypothetical protein